jgi:hypothetical protein
MKATPKARAGKPTVIPKDLAASLIELRRTATDGAFNPDDRSTWPDFSPERQEKDSDKRLSWHLDFAAVTKRWGTAMRNGLDPAAHESILAGAKHLAALSVQADMDGALKELRLDADTSDLRKFRQCYKASLVKNTLAEFRLRLEKYVTVSQFESAIWDERNRTLKGNLSIAEFVDARLQQFVALRKAVDAVVTPATVEDSGAGKLKAIVTRNLKRLKDEAGDRVTFDAIVAGFQRNGFKCTVDAIKKHHTLGKGGRCPRHLKMYAEIYSVVLHKTVSVEWISTSHDDE